jgi:hypothetical protein
MGHLLIRGGMRSIQRLKGNLQSQGCSLVDIHYENDERSNMNHVSCVELDRQQVEAERSQCSLSVSEAVRSAVP